MSEWLEIIVKIRPDFSAARIEIDNDLMAVLNAYAGHTVTLDDNPHIGMAIHIKKARAIEHTRTGAEEG